jgi:hypothetical protein
MKIQAYTNYLCSGLFIGAIMLFTMGIHSPYAIVQGHESTFSLTANENVANVSAAQDTYEPCDFGGRVGRVQFNNKSQYPLKVKLWHSDSKKLFATWNIEGGRTTFLSYDKERINVGDSWGIQLGSSKVKCVGVVADWRNNVFQVSSTDFYNR